MPDWSKSMQQTFEYYIVDPGTWKDVSRLENVKKCTINRDSTVETLGSATIDVVDSVGECYIREYLITIQNGLKEKHPLGTHIVQTPSSNFNGKMREVSMDAYTPLLELKENMPPIGYFVPKKENVMWNAYAITREHVRAPVIKPASDITLNDNFIANTNDTWLSFSSDLAKYAKFSYGLDEMGRVMFVPRQDVASLQPVWTYDDSNSSILLPELTMEHDLYDIPNVVELIFSKGFHDVANDTIEYHLEIVNDDPNSPISTVNRGRRITHREIDPSISGDATDRVLLSKHAVENYAIKLLKELSSVEYVITYTHGYCGTRLGDCIRLNYTRAGLTNIKAKIISQSIKCEPGCPVTEKAAFTEKLWR